MWSICEFSISPPARSRPTSRPRSPRLLAEGKAISADAVKAIVATPARAELPVLQAPPIDSLGYDALLTDSMRFAQVGT